MNTNQNFGYNAALAQPYPNTVTQLPNWFDMNAVNSMANEHFIFKDLTPATISDVNKIIDNYLIKLNLPHTDQIIQAAYNSIMPMVDAKLKNANASYQNNVGVLTKAVEEILKKYESAIMLNAKLSQERKKAPRKFYFNASGIGVCFDKHTEIEVGYISIQQVINVEIEKDNSYKYYKYVTYYYKPGASDTIMIPLEDVAGRTLIRHFEHFNAICSSKPMKDTMMRAGLYKSQTELFTA